LLPKLALIFNQSAVNSLVKATQDSVLKAAADAEARGWSLSQEKNKWYLDQLKAKGMNIVTPPAQLNADLKKIGDVMVADWVKKAGPDGQAIVDAYKKM
jgi:TRAP-type C4-dicarboxylate transport system substrate-binding protein